MNKSVSVEVGSRGIGEMPRGAPVGSVVIFAEHGKDLPTGLRGRRKD